MTQKREAADGQPFSDQDVAGLQKNCRVRRDELTRGEFISGLLAPGSDFSVRGLAIAELRDHFVLAIENANLAVEIRTNHPFVFCVKVARHAEP